MRVESRGKRQVRLLICCSGYATITMQMNRCSGVQWCGGMHENSEKGGVLTALFTNDDGRSEVSLPAKKKTVTNSKESLRVLSPKAK